MNPLLRLLGAAASLSPPVTSSPWSARGAAPATATAARKPKGYDVNPGQAHESALKEAETDAI